MQNLLDTLGEMGTTFSMADIWDVIDILIVAFIIYKLLVLLKNTNAMTGLKGLLVVLALMGFAALFQLHTLSWILTNVIQVGLLALVIIFQPELRKLLEQVGRSRFPKFFGKEVNVGAMNTAILQTVELKQSRARVLMDDGSLAAGALSRVLSSLREERYDLRLPVETEL